MKRTETTDNWDILGGLVSFNEDGGLYEIRYISDTHFTFVVFGSRRKAIRLYLKVVKSILKGESVQKRLNMFI